MQPDDRIRPEHMVEEVEAVLEVIDQHVRHDLDENLTLRLAVVRAIEVLGEAATHVSSETRSAVPSIPWTAIVGMRNRLSDAYFNINYDIVWHTASVEIPGILPSLRAALRSSDDC